MKSSYDKNARSIEKLEDLRASSGAFGAADSSIERQVHEAQVKAWDTRRALAISSLHKNEAPISFIRSLLQRGNFDQARACIEELKNTSHEDSAAAHGLLMFEEARLAVFESRWNDAIALVGEALHIGAPPVTRLALHQLRALAYFELGQFSQASLDTEEIEQLGRLFPHAVSLLYGRVVKARLLARDVGMAAAEQYLEHLVVSQIKHNVLNLDLILTYLRTEIDFKRLREESFLRESVVCALAADAIGDKLYRGLAELDLHSLFVSSASDLRRVCQTQAKNFSRIQQLLDEVDGLQPISTSALTIQQALPHVSATDDAEYEGLLGDDGFKNVIVVIDRHGLVADLENNKCYALSGQPFLLLKALANGPIGKKQLFAELWGSQVYTEHLHDTLISSLIHRVKKTNGIRIAIRNGLIQSEKTVLLV